MSTVLGWWFAQADANGVVRLPNGDGRVVRAGETLTVPGPVVLCRHGLHASRRAIDALVYAPGPVVCRVALFGEVRHGDDKMAATKRTVLWVADATRELHAFAAGVALGVLRDERDAGREPDPRSWAAVEAKRAWLEGRISDADLAAATADAWAAASAAAWAATWAAARTAESGAATAAAWAAETADAWAAASAAAWAATWAATWTAESGAATAAAWAAERADASAATRDRQSAALEELLMTLAPKETR